MEDLGGRRLLWGREDVLFVFVVFVVFVYPSFLKGREGGFEVGMGEVGEVEWMETMPRISSFEEIVQVMEYWHLEMDGDMSFSSYYRFPSPASL